MTDKSPAPEHDFQQKASWEMETLPPPTSQRGGLVTCYLAVSHGRGDIRSSDVSS